MFPLNVECDAPAPLPFTCIQAFQRLTFFPKWFGEKKSFAIVLQSILQVYLLKSFDAQLYTAHSLSSSHQLTMRKQQCAKVCWHRPSCEYGVSSYLTAHVLYSWQQHGRHRAYSMGDIVGQ